MDLRDADITNEVIAAGIRVHRALGPGFLESIYEQALAVEFALSGVHFVRPHPVPLFYRDHQIGEHRLDFLIEGKIVAQGHHSVGRYPFRNRQKLPQSRQSSRRAPFELRDRSPNY